MFSTSKRQASKATLPWLLAGAFLLGSATTGGAFAAGMVRSADIVDGQVKRVDIADSAVNGAKVQDGSIRSVHLAPGKWVQVEPPHEGDACDSSIASTFCGATISGNWYWQNFGEGTQPVRFRRDATGEVSMEGIARGFTLLGTIFILPTAYRPQHTRVFAVSCATISATYVAARVTVYANGHVRWENDSDDSSCWPRTYLSFDGIRFATE